MTYPINALTVEAYSTGTSQIADLPGNLLRAEGLAYQTTYPGGIYATASFYVGRSIFNQWQLKGARRVVIRNGRTIVYEGYITNLQRSVEETAQGIMVRCIGGWGKIMMGWRWRHRWADTRVSEDAWIWNTAATAAEKADIERTARMRITPKNVSWTSGEVATVLYYPPTGENIARVTYDYAQAGGSMNINFNDATNGETVIVAGGGSGSNQTYTLGTPITTALAFRLKATGTHTPAADGSVYGQLSNVTVYSDINNPITMDDVASDLITQVTDLNSDTRFVTAAASTLTIEPFMADDWETAAEILDNAVGHGDGANNRWAAGLYHSERATTPDGKPVMFLEQYPVTTSYDYVVSIEEPNVISGVNISQDVDAIANYVIVSYTDENGILKYRTPNDNASLTDATSTATYGTRAYTIHIGDGTSTLADNVGIRYLATYKDPQWRLIGALTLQDFVRKVNGDLEPVSQVRAGKRIKIENFKEDLSGTGVTFVITQTDYRDDDQAVAIGTGVPSGIILPRYSHPARLPVDPVPTSRSTTGGRGGNQRRNRRRNQPAPAPAPAPRQRRSPTPQPTQPRDLPPQPGPRPGPY